MKQKLIITIWKAQLTQQFNQQSIYCLLNYNKQSKNTKSLPTSKSFQWKQTFIFPLAKQQTPLTLYFIPLNKRQQIHFAKDNLAQTLSIAKAVLKFSIKNPTKGSLPKKIDIIDNQNDNKCYGKLFLEYQVLKTEVTDVVEKIIDYNYVLKLSNFKVNFLRQLKKVPEFYLKLNYGQKIHKQGFPFNQEKKQFYYNYPVKINIDKQIQMLLELEVKQINGIQYNSPNQSLKSQRFSDKKSERSSIGKKNNTLDLGFNSKITGLLDLNFKQNLKIMKKIPLMIPYKHTKQQIGSIQFQIQTIFKTLQEKKAIQQQKNGINLDNPQKSSTLSPQKKRKANVVQQSNGIITLNTIMSKLELSNDQLIRNKDISLTLKLGKQIYQSTVLQNPGNQLIFIDQFNFKRTWQQTINFIINVHNQKGLKIPTFYSSINLRQLFEQNNIKGKKIKILDENKQFCGQFTLEMEYKEEQKKVIKQQKSIIESKSKILRQQTIELKNKQKKQKIAQRLRQKQVKKQKQKQEQKSLSKVKDRDLFTIAQALDLKDLILPPLKSRRTSSSLINSNRYSTVSPRNQPTQKLKGANVFNSNGRIRFSKSPRFQQPKSYNGDSFLSIRQSDFDIKKKRGPSIGYGDKYDFTKYVKDHPGIGKYQIPSLWDKYN